MSAFIEVDTEESGMDQTLEEVLPLLEQAVRRQLAELCGLGPTAQRMYEQGASELIQAADQARVLLSLAVKLSKFLAIEKDQTLREGLGFQEEKTYAH